MSAPLPASSRLNALVTDIGRIQAPNSVLLTDPDIRRDAQTQVGAAITDKAGKLKAIPKAELTPQECLIYSTALQTLENLRVSLAIAEIAPLRELFEDIGTEVRLIEQAANAVDLTPAEIQNLNNRYDKTVHLVAGVAIGLNDPRVQILSRVRLSLAVMKPTPKSLLNEKANKELEKLEKDVAEWSFQCPSQKESFERRYNALLDFLESKQLLKVADPRIKRMANLHIAIKDLKITRADPSFAERAQMSWKKVPNLAKGGIVVAGWMAGLTIPAAVLVAGAETFTRYYSPVDPTEQIRDAEKLRKLQVPSLIESAEALGEIFVDPNLTPLRVQAIKTSAGGHYTLIAAKGTIPLAPGNFADSKRVNDYVGDLQLRLALNATVTKKPLGENAKTTFADILTELQTKKDDDAPFIGALISTADLGLSVAMRKTGPTTWDIFVYDPIGDPSVRTFNSVVGAAGFLASRIPTGEVQVQIATPPKCPLTLDYVAGADQYMIRSDIYDLAALTNAFLTGYKKISGTSAFKVPTNNHVLTDPELRAYYTALARYFNVTLVDLVTALVRNAYFDGTQPRPTDEDAAMITLITTTKGDNFVTAYEDKLRNNLLVLLREKHSPRLANLQAMSGKTDEQIQALVRKDAGDF